MKVYCYSRCTTCKKALKWLDDKGVSYEPIDIKTDHPDEDTLRRIHARVYLCCIRIQIHTL